MADPALAASVLPAAGTDSASPRSCATPALITDIFGVLDRHGYTRADTAHTARAILLIFDLAHIYQASLDHPFGPAIGEPPPQAAPETPGPDAVVLPAGDLSTIIAALDEASEYKRDRIEAWLARLIHCPTAVNRSFLTAVNAQTAIATRQASG